MKAINIEILKNEGVANPEAVYNQIAAIGGFGRFDSSYRPTLDVSGLGPEEKRQVDKIIADSKGVKK